jgi:asparagine synthase (glutamine-hydrolysing)
MRTAGIYAQDTGAVSRFLGNVIGPLDEGERRQVRTLAFPTEAPKVAVVVAESAKPAVYWASRPDGSFAIVDGEVYDVAHVDGTADAQGNNDAYKVLNLYVAGGQGAIAQLDAAATMVIWDSQRSQLLVFRDRSGIVPGFYVQQPDGVLWASDIGTLLRTEVPRKVNLAALDFFLGNGFVPSPWTLIERINKIPPAHILRCTDRGAVEVHRYWWPRGRPKFRLGEQETAEQLGSLLLQSLRRRVSAGRATGVLLSAGVDSKLIVAGLQRLGACVDTFTFRYTDYDGKWNEVDEARRIATYFGTRHHEMTYRPADIVDNLAWMLRSYGEPFTYGLHSCMLRDVTAAGVTALLNGAGPDGWYLDRFNRYGVRVARLPTAAQRVGRSAVSALRCLNAAKTPLWLWRMYAAAGSLADQAEPVLWCAETGLPSRLRSMIWDDALRSRLYQDKNVVESSRAAAEALFRSATADFDGESDRDKITFIHRHFVNPEGTLYWNHWWGRAHGLVVRFPYFDRDLADFVMRLPRASQKDGEKKEVRQLAATLMPRELAYTPKVPQTVPIAHWFRGPLKDFLYDQLSPARLSQHGLFNVPLVQRMLRDHVLRKKRHEWKLWGIVSVLLWHEFVLRTQMPPQPKCNSIHVP